MWSETTDTLMFTPCELKYHPIRLLYMSALNVLIYMELDYHVEESGRMWKMTVAIYCRELDIQGRDVGAEARDGLGKNTCGAEHVYRGKDVGVFVGYL